MFGFSQARNAGLGFVRAQYAGIQGLKAYFFDTWQPVLDEALHSLPETDLLPHDLFRLLMTESNPETKQTIMMTERGVPVALVGLRHREGYWEPVTQWIVPGVPFLVKADYLESVIAAIPFHVSIAWWRLHTSPPEIKKICYSKTSPTYKMLCSEDFELYWKSSGHLNTVKRMRNRCRDFEFEINPAGASEWVIRNWGNQWNISPGELQDRIITAGYLEKTGLHFTLILKDKQTWIAGDTFLSHNNEAVWQVSYRHPDYDSYGVGTRLMDLSFQWASKEGFQKIDLGGDHEYKLRWAPIDGEKHVFTICPGYIMVAKRVSELAWKARNTLMRNLKRNPR
jgi:hypothetical protein